MFIGKVSQFSKVNEKRAKSESEEVSVSQILMVDDYFSENLKSVVGGGSSQEIVLDEENVAKIVEALSNQTSSIRSEK